MPPPAPAPGVLLDPRRSPRVPLRVAVDVAQGANVWQATTDDVGPGGCQLVTCRPLARLAVVRLLVRAGEVPESLSLPGVVAWTGAARLGVRFTPESAGEPLGWFERLLAARPELQLAASRVPGQLATALPLFFLPGHDGDVELAPDELQLLSRFSNGVAAGWLAARAGLPEDRFARALFALLERRVLTACKQEAVLAWLRLRPRGRPSPAAPAPGPTAAPARSSTARRP